MTTGDPHKDYASEWKQWRKSQGWTQLQMASTLGVCIATIDNIENGRHRPSVASREKLKALQQRYAEAQL